MCVCVHVCVNKYFCIVVFSSIDLLVYDFIYQFIFLILFVFVCVNIEKY